MVELKSRVTGYLENIYFQDGQDITAGKPLFDIDRRLYKADYDRAAAALNKAEQHFKTAQKNFRREDDSQKSGTGSREAFDKASGDLAEAEADIGSATAALELATANLRFTRISAPFDGRLSKRMVDPGNLVKADETVLTTIVALDTLYATFDVDERTVMKFRKLIEKGRSDVVPRAAAGRSDWHGRRRGHVPALGLPHLYRQPDRRGHRHPARPRHGPQPATETAAVVHALARSVRPRADADRQPASALLVPEKSLGADQGQKYVYVVNDRDEVERRNVRLGPQFGNFRVIENNVLKAGDRVIVDGLLRVRPGTKVNPKPAEPIAMPEIASPLDTAPTPRSK